VEQPSWTDKKIQEASQLPLKDAAFSLWKQRHRLEPRRPVPQKQGSRSNLSNPAEFTRTVLSAIASVRVAYATAHDGPTFDWLRDAHPEASDEKVKAAIRVAVKLDQDCSKYFSYQSPHYIDDVKRAIEMAKKENPGFLESTYKLADFYLATEMR
jgi:hypothetical protein